MISVAGEKTTEMAAGNRWQVIFAGICALILTVGLARFAYTPLLPIMRDKAGLSYLAENRMPRSGASEFSSRFLKLLIKR